MYKTSVTVAVCALSLGWGCSSSSGTATDTSSGGDPSSKTDASTGSEGPGSPGDGPGSPGDGPGSPGDGSGGVDGGLNPLDPIELPGGGFITLGTSDAGVFEVLCGGEPCACSDGKDNDGDGVSDGFDDECTGPFDNDEATFATGIPGDNQDPKWQDCFFDGNSGAGDDGCRYHTDCITGDADATDEKKCSVSQECIDSCQPLTPPGCDCFGCCGVTVEGENINILVGESCSTENIDDEEACPRCTPTTACQNECGTCELCVGKGIEDLPDECFTTPPPPTGSGGSGSGGSPNVPPPGSEDPPPNVCDSGAQACVSSADCGSSSYCSLGCCKLSISVK